MDLVWTTTECDRLGDFGLLEQISLLSRTGPPVVIKPEGGCDVPREPVEHAVRNDLVSGRVCVGRGPAVHFLADVDDEGEGRAGECGAEGVRSRALDLLVCLTLALELLQSCNTPLLEIG